MENTNEEKTIGQVIANGFKQAFSIFESESETKRKERAEAEKKEAEEAKAKKEKKEAEESEAKRKLESDAEAKKKLEAEDEGKAEKFAKKIMEAEDEDEYEAAKKEAAKHFECKEAELPPVIKKAIEKKEASFKEKKEAENEAKKKEFESLKKLFPQMKNIEEMQTAYKMAQKPTKVSVGAQFEGVTYTELNAAGNKEGKKLIDSVKRSMGSTKDLSKHQILLSAILNDPKFSVFLSKFRVNTKDAGGNLNSTFDTMELARRVMTGDMDSIATNGRSGKFVQLSGSDSFLATPDTLVVEFLPLIIPYLFASTSWKRNITMFPAKLTSESHGLIWANNAAQPAIYEGTQPSNPANYTIADTPVSLALPAFFLQPMLWNPLYTAQLRYDQVSVQWEQALRKMMEAMDDYLIYTLASAVPVSSHILTTGASFAAGESPNIFKLNPSFIGSLLKPQLIDTLSITQLYDNQNFPDGTEHDLILDPIMKKYILEDPLTQSKLTTLLTEDGKTLVQYADTVFGGRSKVALYDLNSKTVINPNGIIPPNSVGAALDLIGTEAGIGVANFDVFMQQDPTNYGIKMSAETRMGANLLRANGYGSALYIYNPASSIY
jgi:hypothetical protein